MTNDLRPCPFCGGEAHAALAAYASGATAHVVCDGCGAKVYGYSRGERGLRDAVESWNRRAERTCHVESSHEEEGDGCYSYFEYELTCGHETAWGDQLPPSYCPECGRRVLYDSNDYI